MKNMKLRIGTPLNTKLGNQVNLKIYIPFNNIQNAYKKY